MTSSFASATSAWSPSLSPDGTRVAYVSDSTGAPAIWILDRDSGAERLLESVPGRVNQVRWSVDGQWLAALTAPHGSPRTEVWVLRPDGSALRQIQGTPGGAVFLGPWTHEPGVVAIARTTANSTGEAALEHALTSASREIARGGQPIILDVDGELRLALVRRGPRGARSVCAIDLVRGSEWELMPDADVGSTDLGRVAPNRALAYLRSDAGREFHALFGVQLNGRRGADNVRCLAEYAQGDLEDLVLTADGATLLLCWNFAGRTRCELMNAVTGERTELQLPEAIASEAGFSRDGRWIVFTLEGPLQPRALWLFDRAAGTWERLTGQRPGWIGPTATPTLERFRSFDGLEVTGWLYRAPHAQGSAGPAVIHLHGGPESQERPGYNPLFQELVSRGISVFAPNVRGSSGFGRFFVNADNLEKRFDAITDVAACAHYLIDRGIAARGRIACAGRSYGGYLTLAALVFHPELFVAGVDVCGMSDFHTFYAHTEPWIAVAAYPKYGHPVEHAALLRELSPLQRFDQLRAPLLVVHGANDTNVPVVEAEQTVAAARARGLSVEYLLFPDEGHELSKVENKIRFVRTTADWLDERLCGG